MSEEVTIKYNDEILCLDVDISIYNRGREGNWYNPPAEPHYDFEIRGFADVGIRDGIDSTLFDFLLDRYYQGILSSQEQALMRDLNEFVNCEIDRMIKVGEL